MPSAAFISDIHANKTALEAVLADIDSHGVDTTYCLGDLVGYGPDPNGVIDFIRSRSILTITGNYDDGVGWERGDCGCFYATAEAKRLGEASYLFTVGEVTDENKAFLRELPFDRHAELALQPDSIPSRVLTLHLVHGSPRKVNEYLLTDRDERTFLRVSQHEDDDVLVFGHTHQAWHRVYGGVHFVNVGSVGRPKDGDPRAMYTVLHATPGGALEVEARRVLYDTEAAALASITAGLPRELAEGLRLGR